MKDIISIVLIFMLFLICFILAMVSNNIRLKKSGDTEERLFKDGVLMKENLIDSLFWMLAIFGLAVWFFFSLLDFYAKYRPDEKATFARYEELVTYNEFVKNDTSTNIVDYDFYKEVARWNQFVKEKKALMEEPYAKNLVSSWFNDLQYIEILDDVNFVSTLDDRIISSS